MEVAYLDGYWLPGLLIVLYWFMNKAELALSFSFSLAFSLFLSFCTIIPLLLSDWASGLSPFFLLLFVKYDLCIYLSVFWGSCSPYHSCFAFAQRHVMLFIHLFLSFLFFSTLSLHCSFSTHFFLPPHIPLLVAQRSLSFHPATVWVSLPALCLLWVRTVSVLSLDSLSLSFCLCCFRPLLPRLCVLAGRILSWLSAFFLCLHVSFLVA